MKKYIVSQMIIALCVTCHVHSMEINYPSAPDKNGVCYLNTLPVDMLNYIASFLTCDDETDEEFIARTFAEKQEKEREFAKYAYNDVRTPNLMVENYNIYKTKKITLAQEELYEFGEEGVNGAWLHDSVINKCYIHKEKIEEDLYDINCYSLALSPCGTMFALCHYKNSSDQTLCRMVLEVIKIDVQEQQEGAGILVFQKKREFDCHTFDRNIAFNKQGNAIIAYEVCVPYNHKIFPLKVVDPDAPKIMDDTNNLQRYLRDKGVFKNKCIEGR